MADSGSQAAEQAARSLRTLPDDLAARLPQLLEAMVSVGNGLRLHSVLDRIVETAASLTGARHAEIGVVSDAGDGLSDSVTYGVRAKERERLSVPIRVGDEVFGNLQLTEKREPGGFTAHDLRLVKVLATEAGIQIGNARLYETTRQSERWIDGSVAVTTALLAGADAEESLSVVAEHARGLADSAVGLVLLPAAEGGLEIAAVATDEGGTGGVAAGVLGAVISPESSVVERLLAGEAVFVEDSADGVRLVGAAAERFGPCMMLPLRSDDRVLGVLATPRLPGAQPFTEAERTLATQFATQAALALMMAEAQRDRERLAVFEDRDRIARDLHDLVIQRLFSTGMMLESAQRGAVVPEVREGVSKAVDELDVTIQEIRTAIFALQQGPTEVPSGLCTRVLREINMAAVPLGFTPAHRFVGPVDSLVGELTGKNLIAALREALSNAFRHAQATRIEVVVEAGVELADGSQGVRLTVADDGVGIPEGGRRSGLRNLRRRAEELGGESWYGPGIGDGGGGEGGDGGGDEDGGRGGTTLVWQAPF
ncbi:GAF domain-containing protein [Streptomyces apocyni]|uniref:GAF domain-containing protein n=1 Tax=Streptomyces apocyni TaxID=2654677 RepID=UPI0012EAF688